MTRKKDDIFDQYLEEPDWSARFAVLGFEHADTGSDLQPRRALPNDVERFLDLAATEEDHGEVGRKASKCCGLTLC